MKLKKKDIKGTIENWALIIVTTLPYQAPEQGTPCITGEVYGHSGFADGTTITTSRVEGWDTTHKAVVTHSGSGYVLGKVSAKYERQYPDAYNRLVTALLKKG